MEENKFWLLVWSLVAAVVATLIIATSVYNIRKNNLIAASPTPLELACAIDGEHSTLKQNCMILLTRGR